MTVLLLILTKYILVSLYWLDINDSFLAQVSFIVVSVVS